MADKTVEPATDEEVQALNDKWDAEQERAKAEYLGTSEGNTTKPLDQAAQRAIAKAANQAREVGLSDDAIMEAARVTQTTDDRATTFETEISKAQLKQDRDLMNSYADGEPVDMEKVIEAMRRQEIALPAGYGKRAR